MFKTPFFAGVSVADCADLVAFAALYIDGIQSNKIYVEHLLQMT
jgi:hypothetical protein